ncbi:glycerate kinase [Paludicola sp. MB14-C6]|uniref:glycerate kinase family protein n=1 Tax=Paludihabitans sp. MB14-C6 TaxID=3070656 RepID=UPI0027DCA6D2|nr:glycerate kinase [Paludicola sp. MB14-C6]WMJ22823.1 glycerate kinase [Paludicola sp. MB14-C6]
MKKIVLIPDSFKGTMSSGEICDIMEKSIKKTYPSAQIISIPVADGGEGSVDAFLCAVGGEKKKVIVKGPYFEDVEAFYGVIDNGETAIIEMAACAGLPLVGDNKNPKATTTYGVGQLILSALEQGCKKIIMGLGGSATNDAGTGAAAALGIKFTDSNNKEFIPVGGTLKNIAHIDMTELDNRLKSVQFITMCDIDNPLFGESGAAFIFAPQKGATPNDVLELDDGLKHISNIIKKDLNKDVSELKGAGAAGGMGGGMVAFFNSKLQMGIETVLDTVNFDSLAKDADMVFSGEGKIDSQSIRGKVVIGVAKRTKLYDIPLVAIVGDIGDDIEEAYDKGVSAIFSINRVAVDFKYAKQRAKDDLFHTMDNLMRFIHTLKKQ